MKRRRHAVAQDRQEGIQASGREHGPLVGYPSIDHPVEHGQSSLEHLDRTLGGTLLRRWCRLGCQGGRRSQCQCGSRARVGRLAGLEEGATAADDG